MINLAWVVREKQNKQTNNKKTKNTEPKNQVKGTRNRDPFIGTLSNPIKH